MTRTTSRGEKRDMPSLPNKFYVGLEQSANWEDSLLNQIMLIEESYDNELNQLSIIVKTSGQEAQNIVDFNSNQLFSIEKSDVTVLNCEFHSCTTAECKEVLTILNPQMSQFNYSSKRIFSGRRLFGLDDDNPPVYMGVHLYENIPLERWDTCEPGGQINRSVYWTVDTWQTAVTERVPFGAKVTTKLDDGILKTYTTTVAWFKPGYVDAQSFQMPEGIICEQWKSELTFPVPPTWADAFQFRSEVLDTNDKFVGRTREWFDVHEGLYRIDQEQKRDAGGNIAMTEIIDKAQGQVYMMTENICYRRKIEETTFDIMSSAAASTSLLEASKNSTGTQLLDFFGSNVTNYLFDGNQITRSIQALVWQGQRKSSSGVKSIVTAVWKWHFTVVNDDGHLASVPLQRDLYILENADTEEGSVRPGTRILHLIYDFQYLAKDHMDPEIFDLTTCFKSENWLHLKVQISAGKQVDGRAPGTDFFRLWRKILAEKAGVDLLGIAQTELRFLDDFTWLQFKLLPLEVTNDATNASNVLAASRSRLESAINADQVSIIYQETTVHACGPLRDVVVTCPAPSTTESPLMSSTAAETTATVNLCSPLTVAAHVSSEPRFNAGVAAAVAVSFFVFGVGIASGGTYFVYTRGH